ncbi:MAG TPA: hypothetical protein VNG12_12965 [Acidimicrobiales bacterium]|nr:hypothetical protein [Acidimicrobiales bacterium]
MMMATEPSGMVILAADIRASTQLMKEAVDVRNHAAILTSFVGAASEHCRRAGGWFDKFLGDGFFGYWLEPSPAVPFMVALLNLATELHTFFDTTIREELRWNSRNMPIRAGLTIGIDGGYGHIVRVCNDFTVFGAPVVGAFRMLKGAQGGETVLNSTLGHPLFEMRDSEPLLSAFAIERVSWPSTEYPDGQEVYVITPRVPPRYILRRASQHDRDACHQREPPINGSASVRR